jgi:hypothetical protein
MNNEEVNKIIIHQMLNLHFKTPTTKDVSFKGRCFDEVFKDNIKPLTPTEEIEKVRFFKQDWKRILNAVY